MRLPALNSRWMSLGSARWRGPSVSRIDRRTSIRSSSTSSRLTNLVEVNVSASLSTAQTSSYRVTAQKPEPMSRSSFQCTGSSRRNVSNIPHASLRAKASRSERSTSANGTGVGLGTAHSNRLGPNNKHVPHLAQGARQSARNSLSYGPERSYLNQSESRNADDRSEGVLLPPDGGWPLLPHPVATVVLLRRPAHRRVPHRPRAGRRIVAGPTGAGRRGPRRRGAHLGRLAVLFQQSRGAARS